MRPSRYEDYPAAIDSSLKYIDPDVAKALDRALSLKDIDEEDALSLLRSRGLEAWLTVACADYLRWLAVGDVVTFVVNRNIQYTDYCINNCKFCAFSTREAERSWTLSTQEVLRKVEEAFERGATEVCIQGGINPKLSLDYYLGMVREIKRKFPSIHIHAFSPQEVHYMAEASGLPHREVLRALKEEGLDSIPGTAAEILDDDVRRTICPSKISTELWVDIVRAAHRLGIPSTATMMYGHVEGDAHKVRHLKVVRDLQKETGGFTEFVLLPFVHYNTELYLKHGARPSSSGIEDVKTHAVARVYFSNYIRNIQASWVKLGPKLVQALLHAGCNDVGGTLMEENISRAAGSPYSRPMSVEELVRMIREAGRVPAQRDTLYKVLRVLN
ncbi:MAG: 5-amino-6-(D-ribitylamino)uracil--L-tyrosine 4-hydroxyphenyl transferase CofH [Candidatus Nezhaarchaeota archaeon]|nr:5-amino-6-(D-ribitylamino)uracil--L-tyrosine 4-hydroxyphenyl transferase CofH [Candidatus Nezhaarchaeota archaeon]